MVSILLGAVRRMERSQALSLRSSLFMAMDHSSGSIGGMPAVCIARWRMVTASRGWPATAKSGRYFTTGSWILSLPSQCRMQAHSAVMDLLIEAMPNIVSLSGMMLSCASRKP